MFDVVVIGGGPGGYKTAELLGKKGLKVALIEEKNLGGVCLNQGCIPFKSYLHATKIRLDAKKMIKEKTADECNVILNQNHILQKKDQIVKGLQQSVAGMLRSNGVQVYYGHAEVLENDESGIKINVEGERIECSKVVLATGSVENRFSDIPENSSYTVIGSSEMLQLERFPESIDIIGGGAIGLEAASYYADAGCEVTLIEATDHIGGPIDLEIAIALKGILSKKGIKVLTDTAVQKFEIDGIVYKTADGVLKRNPQYIMTAIGRSPRIDHEMLKALNVEFWKKGIIVDDQCRTSNSNVYACGDVTGKLMLAHTAYRQAKVVADSICGKEEPMDYQIIPKVIYTNPEVISVGLNEEDCKVREIEYVAVSLPMTYSGKYFAENGKDGAKAKMIVEAKNQQIVGFHMIGNGASEISLAAELMIAHKMTVGEIENLVIAHPTYGEIIGALAECF